MRMRLLDILPDYKDTRYNLTYYTVRYQFDREGSRIVRLGMFAEDEMAAFQKFMKWKHEEHSDLEVITDE